MGCYLADRSPATCHHKLVVYGPPDLFMLGVMVRFRPDLAHSA